MTVLKLKYPDIAIYITIDQTVRMVVGDKYLTVIENRDAHTYWFKDMKYMQKGGFILETDELSQKSVEDLLDRVCF